MLIGIDANEANLTRNRVGINQYAFNLLHAIYKLQTPHSFIIYLKTPPQSDLPREREDWHYRVIPFPKFWTQTRLPFDLFTHQPVPDVFFSMTHYAPRWSPIPTVVAIMDLGFLKTPDQFTPKDFNQLKSWTNYSIRQARKIITISEHSKHDIVKNYGVGPESVAVTYPGFDQTLFKPTKNPEVLKKYGITEPYCLFLSSLKPSKNVEGLVKAFAQLGLEQLTLVIAGKKAWLYDKIFSLVKELKQDHKIIFTGFVEEFEVPVLMTMASAFVMPSFYEGFGIPVLEALACGTPVVISRTTSLPEVAGESGIYVDPDDIRTIVRGLKTALGPGRDKFIKLGFAQAKKFNWLVCAQKTLTVLESAVK